MTFGLDRRYEKFGAVRALAAARRPMAMHHFMVMMDLAMLMRCRVMPMLCRVVRMADEGSARVVPKHLPVAEAAAPALRFARRTRGAVVGVPSAAMGVLRAATGM
jgi:hypothetical protein